MRVATPGRIFAALTLPLTPLSEHPRVIAERLQFPHDNSPEIAVIGMEQAVVFGANEDGGHNQQTMLLPLRKLIAKAHEFWSRRGVEPVSRKRARFDPFRAHVIGNFSDSQYKVLGRVVLIEVTEILQHRQRLMLRRITETNSGTRPTSSIVVGALPVERILRVSLAEHPVEESQLIPP